MDKPFFFGNYDIVTLAPRNGVLKLNITCDGTYDPFNSKIVCSMVDYNCGDVHKDLNFDYNDGIAIELNAHDDKIIFDQNTFCKDSRMSDGEGNKMYLRSISCSGDIINSNEFGFVPKFNDNNEANVNVIFHF